MTRVFAVHPSRDEAVLRPSPADYLDRDYLVGEDDVLPRVAAVLQWFSAHEQGRHDDRLDKTLLQHLREFAHFVRGQKASLLSDALEKAADGFQAVFDSPLDLDAFTVQTLWDDLWPELERLAEKTNTESSSRKGPILAVRRADLESLARDVSHLSVTAELADGLQKRLADTGQLAALAEELRQLTRQLKDQASSLEKGVLTARCEPVRPLLRQTARLARQKANQKNLALEIHLSDAEIEIDKVHAADLQRVLDHVVEELFRDEARRPASELSSQRPDTAILRMDASHAPTTVSVTLRLENRELATAKPTENAGLENAREILARHQGRLSVEPRRKGTTEIRATLPRVRAVQAVHGLMLRHAGQHFLVPFDSIVEVTFLEPASLKTVHGCPMALLRGETHRAVSLSALLDLEPVAVQPGGSWTAVLVESPAGKACLLAETMLGHRRVVVEKLSELVSDVPKIAGACPIGEGLLALVIDVEQSIRSLG